MKISVAQMKAALSLLKWSFAKLADESKVSVPTIARLSAKGGMVDGRPETTDRIVQALMRNGIRFTDCGVEFANTAARFKGFHRW
jgi:predicted transcriptional regulator